MGEDEEEPLGVHRRMDFVMQPVGRRKEGDYVVFEMEFVPDPDRYERIEKDDFQGYFDRLDGVYYSDSMVEDLLEQMDGEPFLASPPEIEDTAEYVEQRREEIERFLEDGGSNEDEDIEWQDVSQDFLEELAEENDSRFVILCIDLVDSTRLREDLTREEWRDIIQVFFREMSLIVEKFRGYVLDFQGDRVVAYFPDPNFVGMHDNALDCASSMKMLIQDGINPVFESHGLPPIHFRIGMDSGEADIVPIGAPGVKEELGLFGETINLASKIEEEAESDGIYLGEETERNLHTHWRSHVEEVDLDDWEHKKHGGQKYTVYRFEISE
ncbi:adenylate/guanylate cyclase domain-containing protein (plasmid) [Haloterrigena salifodinae]|uniref:Adenylate/guanylate cyclase domain-containing protein n=1 Tax=Haloterrigena salifodinae TaxID=2675099 RepID=A0A8T8E6E9_9EURY|nr:adenylate/guanylate cyclase domain-containing protein [Haloterrigena salifodinae]QRV17445.1 adenylate/guanylate cyclase domain-containing protein [Haloterrigena salifodinae]